MKDSYYTLISLRMRHPTIDVEEFCKKLNLIPAFVRKKGDLIVNLPEHPRYWEKFYCTVKFEIQNRKIYEYLKEIISKFDKKQVLLFSKTGGDIDFSIDIFVNKNGIELIDSELMGLLSDLNIQLLFFLYRNDLEMDVEHDAE